MKRLLLLITVVMVGVTTLYAQSGIKVDEAKIKANIDKALADTQHAKKGTQSKTWITLGKVYYDATMAPVAGVYAGLDEAAAGLLIGKPSSSSVEKIGVVDYKKNTYSTLDGYFYNGQLRFWKPTKVVVPNGLDLAAQAYYKAYEMDKAAKVAPGLDEVANAYKEESDNYFGLQEFVKAGKAFAAAYDIQREAPINRIDTLTGYNAGFMYTLGSDYANGRKYLESAVNQGYDADGDAYYYLFHTYFGEKDYVHAKEVLLKGISKYPGNNNIIESLMGLYAETGEDPQEIIPSVQKAINEDPDNPELYSGMGHIYNKMGDVDSAIAAFQKSLSISPNDANFNFNLGLMMAKKGDKIAEDARGLTVTSREEYQKIQDAQLQAYRDALLPFEKAYTLDPTNQYVVEYLKTLYFRLRDEPGMMDQYNKYNELLKTMQ